MAIEDEIIHWWKDEKGMQRRTILRVESVPPEINNGFPRDGYIFIKIFSESGGATIRINPDEALRLSTQLLNISRELLNKKRKLWNSYEPIREIKVEKVDHLQV